MNRGIPVPQDIQEAKYEMMKVHRPTKIIGKGRAAYERYIEVMDAYLEQLFTDHDYAVNQHGEHCTGMLVIHFLSELHYSNYFVDKKHNYVSTSQEQWDRIEDFFVKYHHKYLTNKDYFNYLLDDYKNDGLIPFIILYAYAKNVEYKSTYNEIIDKAIIKCDEVINDNTIPINHYEDVVYENKSFSKDKYKYFTRTFLPASKHQALIKYISSVYPKITYTDEQHAEAIIQMYNPYKGFLNKEDMYDIAYNNGLYFKYDFSFFTKLANAISKFLESDKYDLLTKVEIFFVSRYVRDYSIELNNAISYLPDDYYAHKLQDKNYSIQFAEKSKEYITNKLIDLLVMPKGYQQCNKIIALIKKNGFESYFHELFQEREVQSYENLFKYKGQYNVINAAINNVKWINDDMVKVYIIKMILATSPELKEEANRVFQMINEEIYKNLAKAILSREGLR